MTRASPLTPTALTTAIQGGTWTYMCNTIRRKYGNRRPAVQRESEVFRFLRFAAFVLSKADIELRPPPSYFGRSRYSTLEWILLLTNIEFRLDFGSLKRERIRRAFELTNRNGEAEPNDRKGNHMT